MSMRIDKENLEPTLREHVENWLKETAEDSYDGDQEAVYRDLMKGGCQSGMVGHLIYYNDTLAFYQHYQEDIGKLLYQTKESTGLSIEELFGEKWDRHDPLARETTNQNLLAWFGFEETARIIMEEERGVEL